MTERERFLKWYVSEYGSCEDARLARPFAWQAWQARCPEGWHEPTAIKIREMCEGMTGNQIKRALDGALSAAPKPEEN